MKTNLDYQLKVVRSFHSEILERSPKFFVKDIDERRVCTQSLDRSDKKTQTPSSVLPNRLQND